MIFGSVWALVFFVTLLLPAIGDCERDPSTHECMNKTPLIYRAVVWGELLMLVAGGWIFYRREMKDGDF